MLVRFVSGAAVLFLSLDPLFGQSATAEFNGSVVDQSGAVLPGADVSDYVAPIGRDQSGKIDINEGPVDAEGHVAWQGVVAFDPDGTLIPAAARGVNFRRVLQYQPLDAFDNDYHALELGLDNGTPSLQFGVEAGLQVTGLQAGLFEYPRSDANAKDF
jgi:hypothetical protein